MLSRAGRIFVWPIPSLWGRVIAGALLCVFLLMILSQSAFAAQTVPYKINFQGRLTSSAGVALADGSYNMRLRLYSVSSGGTALWTETRQATNRIQVTNGQFSIQLGDVTAFSPSLFSSGTYPLYLEVELPTPATATCSTSACASWAEGAMTPRRPLGASPYAMNADTVDGVDSGSFARRDQSNIFGSAQTVRVDSTAALRIADTSDTSLLVADTTNMTVNVSGGFAVREASGTDVLSVVTPTDGVPIVTVYNIGDTGPAGGIVFYDKGDSVGGWRYLEASTSDQSSGAPWGCQGSSIGTNTTIGTGAQNTADIVANCSDIGTAAKVADAYNINGYSDWFLPSKDELNELYLQKGLVGGFSDVNYWSSSENGASAAQGQYFSSGSQFSSGGKASSYAVRAIRAFDGTTTTEPTPSAVNINGTMAIKSNSERAFQIQDAGGTSLLAVDTSANKV
jgi:hypothetical protein